MEMLCCYVCTVTIFAKMRVIVVWKMDDPEACFNNTSLPLGVNFVPRGELCFLRGMYTPLLTPGGKHYSVEKRRG
jgi:hypothetical protein